MESSGPGMASQIVLTVQAFTATHINLSLDVGTGRWMMQFSAEGNLGSSTQTQAVSCQPSQQLGK